MYTNYMDLDSRQGRRILVWPVPYEATVTFATGTKHGPQAIIKASCEIETWNEEHRIELSELAHFDNLPFFRPVASGPEHVYRQMLDYLKSNLHPGRDFLLTLGGEHSVALAPIAFYQLQYPELVVLQLDAHADLRNSYENSYYSHACVMARVRDLGLPIIQLGIRSLSKGESEMIHTAGSHNISTYFAWDLADPEQTAEQIREQIQGRPLYISFDADALDPSLVPGTGTPEPGGITYKWLSSFWSCFFSGLTLVGMDFCELSPLPGCGVVSESAAVKCINHILLHSLKSENISG